MAIRAQSALEFLELGESFKQALKESLRLVCGRWRQMGSV